MPIITLGSLQIYSYASLFLQSWIAHLLQLEDGEWSSHNGLAPLLTGSGPCVLLLCTSVPSYVITYSVISLCAQLKSWKELVHSKLGGIHGLWLSSIHASPEWSSTVPPILTPQKVV